MFKIEYSHGLCERYDTYDEAIAAIESIYSDAEIGHDGDISDGGNRTLFWACAEDAINDSGTRAAGSIRWEIRL